MNIVMCFICTNISEENIAELKFKKGIAVPVVISDVSIRLIVVDAKELVGGGLVVVSLIEVVVFLLIFVAEVNIVLISASVVIVEFRFSDKTFTI